jgi:glycosyltransferase involved in cell wall biosynthesis
MHILVYKNELCWPRHSGHDVHTYEMMRAWTLAGTQVSLVTANTIHPKAVEGITLESINDLSTIGYNKKTLTCKNGLQQRFIRYWGIPNEQISSVAELIEKIKADAIIVSGLDALPFLCQVRNCVRVWYAADEWAWHHLSLFQLRKPATWSELKQVVIKGLYERIFRTVIDRIWVVSNMDYRAMRIVSGVKNIDIIPNGVNHDYFHPFSNAIDIKKSLIFWGRLDFEPNIQGLEWFCQKVWPALQSKHQDAVFSIIGAKPVEKINALGKLPGIRILPNLSDLRPEVAIHQVVVLPFISGGGIKNKLLEATSMGKAVVCSKKAASGLIGELPIIIADSAKEWIEAIECFWSNQLLRIKYGTAARKWVCKEYTWEKAASNALIAIQKSIDATC